MEHIETVKEIRNIKTEEFRGYWVNGIEVAEGEELYNQALDWIAKGGEVEPAYTPEERQAYFNKQYNIDILSQIKTKESGLIRPIREILSITATVEAKAFAQTKIDTIEAEIQELRNGLR